MTHKYHLAINFWCQRKHWIVDWVPRTGSIHIARRWQHSGYYQQVMFYELCCRMSRSTSDLLDGPVPNATHRMSTWMRWQGRLRTNRKFGRLRPPFAIGRRGRSGRSLLVWAEEMCRPVIWFSHDGGVGRRGPMSHWHLPKRGHVLCESWFLVNYCTPNKVSQIHYACVVTA